MLTKRTASIIITILSLLIVSVMVYGAAKKAATEKSGSEKYKGWKTYRNEKYGYELKYPKGIVGAFLQSQKKVPTAEAEEIRIKIEKDAYLFMIEVGDNPLKLSAKQHVEKLIQDYEIEKKKDKYYPPLIIYKQGELMIGKISAYFIDAWTPEMIERRVYIPKDDKMYFIIFPTAQNPNDKNAEKHFELYQLMLSSFKFIK